MVPRYLGPVLCILCACGSSPTAPQPLVDAGPDASPVDAGAPADAGLEDDLGVLDEGVPAVDAGRDGGQDGGQDAGWACSVVPQGGCHAGQACRLSFVGGTSPGNGLPVCEAAGPVPVGAAGSTGSCGGAGDDRCQAGLFCWGVCRAYCDPAGEPCPDLCAGGGRGCVQRCNPSLIAGNPLGLGYCELAL